MRYSNHNPSDALYFMASETSRPLTEHFAVREFVSGDGYELVLIHPALLLLLEDVRRRFNRPVTVTSGFRSHPHNRAVGGSADSKHLLGMAADIIVRDVPAGRVAGYVETLHPGGLGRYDDFTHVDVFGEDRRWDYRSHQG